MNLIYSKRDAVICLAAGKSQLPIIIKAKKLGYLIIAIDKNRLAPGFKYADYKIYHSTYDSDKVINKIKKLNVKVIGILNKSSGPPVITTAKIAKNFKIPGVKVSVAKTFINKDKMRNAFAKQGLPIPKYFIYKKHKYKTSNKHTLPFIVKPSLSLVGKKGVSVVKSKDKIFDAIKYAENNTINNKILIEEYIEGKDFSLISFVNNFKLFPICLLEELNIESKNGKIIPMGYRTIKPQYNFLKPKIFDIAKKIIYNFEIKRSPLMISFRKNLKNELKIIEIHLDIGGDYLIEKFFPKALSYNFETIAIKMALGEQKLQTNISVKPTAIFYKDREVSDKSCKVLSARTDNNLEKKISKLKL